MLIWRPLLREDYASCIERLSQWTPQCDSEASMVRMTWETQNPNWTPVKRLVFSTHHIIGFKLPYLGIEKQCPRACLTGHFFTNQSCKPCMCSLAREMTAMVDAMRPSNHCIDLTDCHLCFKKACIMALKVLPLLEGRQDLTLTESRETPMNWTWWEGSEIFPN